MAIIPRIEINENELIVHPLPFRNRFLKLLFHPAYLFGGLGIWVLIAIGGAQVLAALLSWIVPAWETRIDQTLAFLFPEIFMGASIVLIIGIAFAYAIHPPRFSLKIAADRIIITHYKTKTILKGKYLISRVDVYINPADKGSGHHQVRFNWITRKNKVNHGHDWTHRRLSDEDMKTAKSFCKEHKIKLI